MENVLDSYGYSQASGGDDNLFADFGYAAGSGDSLGDGWTLLSEGSGSVEEILSDWWGVAQDDLKTFGFKLG